MFPVMGELQNPAGADHLPASCYQCCVMRRRSVFRRVARKLNRKLSGNYRELPVPGAAEAGFIVATPCLFCRVFDGRDHHFLIARNTVWHENILN
mgnify:CR=1 FL=1